MLIAQNVDAVEYEYVDTTQLRYLSRGIQIIREFDQSKPSLSVFSPSARKKVVKLQRERERQFLAASDWKTFPTSENRVKYYASSGRDQGGSDRVESLKISPIKDSNPFYSNQSAYFAAALQPSLFHSPPRGDDQRKSDFSALSSIASFTTPKIQTKKFSPLVPVASIGRQANKFLISPLPLLDMSNSFLAKSAEK